MIAHTNPNQTEESQDNREHLWVLIDTIAALAAALVPIAGFHAFEYWFIYLKTGKPVVLTLQQFFGDPGWLLVFAVGNCALLWLMLFIAGSIYKRLSPFAHEKQRAWQAIMQALLERRRASERQDRAREAQTVDRLEALERVSAEVRFVNQQIITDYSQAFRQFVRELDWLNYLEDRYTFLTAEDKAELWRRQEQLL